MRGSATYLYHGTNPLVVKSIQENGFLLPGEATTDGVTIRNTGGACGAVGSQAPIYMSPSRTYATMYCVPVKGRDAIFVMAIGVKATAAPSKKQGHTIPHIWK